MLVYCPQITKIALEVEILSFLTKPDILFTFYHLSIGSRKFTLIHTVILLLSVLLWSQVSERSNQRREYLF